MQWIINHPQNIPPWHNVRWQPLGCLGQRVTAAILQSRRRLKSLSLYSLAMPRQTAIDTSKNLQAVYLWRHTKSVRHFVKFMTSYLRYKLHFYCKLCAEKNTVKITYIYIHNVQLFTLHPVYSISGCTHAYKILSTCRAALQLDWYKTLLLPGLWAWRMANVDLKLLATNFFCI